MMAEGKDVCKACGESSVRGSAVVHSRMKPTTYKERGQLTVICKSVTLSKLPCFIITLPL